MKKEECVVYTWNNCSNARHWKCDLFDFEMTSGALVSKDLKDARKTTRKQLKRHMKLLGLEEGRSLLIRIKTTEKNLVEHHGSVLKLKRAVKHCEILEITYLKKQ